MSKAMDKKLFYKAKERIGQPWTYSKETKQKLDAELAKGTVTPPDARLAPQYDTSPSKGAGDPKPKKTKPFQQLNGRRSQCVGYKSECNVGSERKLPPVPKDYIAVARAKRIKKHTSKLRKSPC